MSTVTPQDNFSFGRHDAQIEVLMHQQEVTSKRLERIEGDVHDIKMMVAELRGGWKAVLVLSAVGGSLVAALAWVVEHLLLGRYQP